MTGYFNNAKFYQTRDIAFKVKADEEFKQDVIEALERFVKNDWGELDSEDIKANNEAIKYLDRILAAYNTCQGTIWISGECYYGKSYDTVIVLFPHEY